ncbi:hypothetical protein PAUR_a0533 [Pseudoalteromonas aurantia 208]|uniref:Uncharacterized protein n=1 Tax=Pseudoalteromonas aurantia 208 TaxID=1314867 RepID=A0ABR9E893_9GAMM|nr:hypothetical protein [Pseudoalteromonas aurantia 208]
MYSYNAPLWGVFFYLKNDRMPPLLSMMRQEQAIRSPKHKVVRIPSW